MIRFLTLSSNRKAADARDALAKALYERLFNWLVARVNDSIAGSVSDNSYIVGILDIFGFENFKVGRYGLSFPHFSPR